MISTMQTDSQNHRGPQTNLANLEHFALSGPKALAYFCTPTKYGKARICCKMQNWILSASSKLR